MKQILEPGGVATNDLHVLTYVHYMAQTARTDAAKQLFESFLRQEKQFLETRGQDRLGGAMSRDVEHVRFGLASHT
jgi:hypothetical protein